MCETIIAIVLAHALTVFASAQVSYERLLQDSGEPNNWLTYSGNYQAWRYSTLDQVNTANIKRLAPSWLFQLSVPGRFETTPLVVDGILYATGPNDFGFAIDPHTGRTIWRYQRVLPEKLRACCGLVNRGFAALGNKLFMATLDAHVVALDAKTGSVVWDAEAADYRQGYSFTLAPLVVKDKVIVGVSGGEYGTRGFIEAYSADTGKRIWRFYTIPLPHQPGSETWQGDSWKTGGGPAWVTGSYDPELDLLYWGVGNPAPDWYGETRKGDNLYTDSMVALDPNTGTLKWHYQFTPHDLHDWDATEIPVLIDAQMGGQPRKLLLQANRNGFFYVLDRTNGAFQLAKPFVKVTWAEGIGSDGRPVLMPDAVPTAKGRSACPGITGATNYMSPSYDPQTELFYVAAREQCDIVTSQSEQFVPGHFYLGSGNERVPGEKDWGALRAIDPRSGEMKWEFKYYSAPWGGALSTAGGLVFAGDSDGNLIALDAKTGKNLWHFQTGSGIFASPMTYSLDGKQYIVIPSGAALLAFALPDETTGN
jgi:alcohol dehydrogenase (cytochrome c)